MYDVVQYMDCNLKSDGFRIFIDKRREANCRARMRKRKCVGGKDTKPGKIIIIKVFKKKEVINESVSKS